MHKKNPGHVSLLTNPDISRKIGCIVHSNVFVRSSVYVSLVHCECDSPMVWWFPDDFTPVRVKVGHLEFLCSFFLV